MVMEKREPIGTIDLECPGCGTIRSHMVKENVLYCTLCKRVNYRIIPVSEKESAQMKKEMFNLHESVSSSI